MRIQKKMPWDNPVSPIDAKNSIGLFGAFYWGLPGLLGDSVIATVCCPGPSNRPT